jgi:hypothetical protein
MDMMEDNERLLQQFFNDAARQQIDDNGFTDRVMQRIEAEGKLQTSNVRLRTFNRLWNVFCITTFVVLFIVFRGWELLAVHFEVMLRTLAAQSFSINLMMIFSVVFGLLLVGAGEVISSERVRR